MTMSHGNWFDHVPCEHVRRLLDRLKPEWRDASVLKQRVTATRAIAVKDAIAIQVRRFLFESKLTDAEIATELGISRSAVNQWRKNATIPSLKQLMLLAGRFPLAHQAVFSDSARRERTSAELIEIMNFIRNEAINDTKLVGLLDFEAFAWVRNWLLHYNGTADSNDRLLAKVSSFVEGDLTSLGRSVVMTTPTVSWVRALVREWDTPFHIAVCMVYHHDGRQRRTRG
jgi:transcriptional regulator with XRE-family HTH domain